MIGTIINDRYRILQILGSGRCGQTYLAEDTHFPIPAPCVIKQFEPEAKDALSLRKAKYLFAREVKILKLLGKHDRIPSLLDFFRQQEKFYLVHEFVEGQDLAGDLGVPWATADVVNLLQEILEVVELFHREKVIHQDLKPSNIIRRQSDGKLMPIDFGSIKKINNQIASSEGNTLITVPIGTEGYRAPEQKSNKPRLATDIYAIGTIALYALTGVEPADIPLDGETETVQWRDLVDLEPQVAEVIDRMVSTDLDRRYASATEAAIAVRKLKSGGKLFDFKTAIGSAILMLTVVGGGLYYWQLERSLNQTSEVELFETDQTSFPLLYRNKIHSVSMKYPADWGLSLPPEESTAIARFTPPSDESWTITPEVSIEVDPVAGQSLESYTTERVYQITQLPQAKIVDSRPIEFAAGDSHKTIYTTFDGATEQKYLQIWTMRGDSFYSFTYHAAAEDYPEYLKTVEQEMLDTAQINLQAQN